GGRSILPVALLGTIFAGADDHAGNVLRVTDIPWSEQPHLAQRIEAGSGLLFDRCELEANMTGLSPKTGGLGPVLAFDVVDDSGFRPRQESRNHQADAFAAAGRGESQDMFEQPHLAQRIEAGSGLLFDRCELEANMPGLSPKTGHVCFKF